MTHVLTMRNRLGLQDLISDEAINDLPYLTLEEGSKEYEYLHARRKALHGYTPQRLPNFTQPLVIPE
ncbi:hypothetical protein, partial [Bacillus cereus group sp. BC327]